MATAEDLRSIIRRPIEEAVPQAVQMAIGMFNRQQNDADKAVGKEMAKLAKQYVSVLRGITGLKDGWVVSPSSHLLSIDNEDGGVTIDIHWESDLGSGKVDVTVELNKRSGPEKPGAKWKSKFHLAKGIVPSASTLNPKKVIDDPAVRRFLKEEAGRLLAALFEAEWQEGMTERRKAMVEARFKLDEYGTKVKRAFDGLVRALPRALQSASQGGIPWKLINKDEMVTDEGALLSAYFEHDARVSMKKGVVTGPSGGPYITISQWGNGEDEFAVKIGLDFEESGTTDFEDNVAASSDRVVKLLKGAPNTFSRWLKHNNFTYTMPEEVEVQEDSRRKPGEGWSDEKTMILAVAKKLYPDVYVSGEGRNGDFFLGYKSSPKDREERNKAVLAALKKAGWKKARLDGKGLRQDVVLYSKFQSPYAKEDDVSTAQELRSIIEGKETPSVVSTADVTGTPGFPSTPEGLAAKKAAAQKQLLKSKLSPEMQLRMRDDLPGEDILDPSLHIGEETDIERIRSIIEYKGTPHGKQGGSREADLWNWEKKHVGSKRRSGHAKQAKKMARKGERQAAKKDIDARMRGEDVTLEDIGVFLEKLSEELSEEMTSPTVDQKEYLGKVLDTAQQLGRFSSEFAGMLKTGIKRSSVDVRKLGEYGRRVDAAHSILQRTMHELANDFLRSRRGN